MRTKKLVCNLLALAVVAALILLTVFTPGQAPEEYSPGAYATILSLLPPVIAIALALITKEVYSSLFVGVWSARCSMRGATGNWP